MTREILIGYWPLWLLALVFIGMVVVVVGACRGAAEGDRQFDSARAEYEAARAGRPSPAPIDVELMR